MFPHLSRPGARVNLGLLQEAANREFLDTLCDWEGTKALFWDPCLHRAYRLITPAIERELQERKVIGTHFLSDRTDQQTLVDPSVRHVIFVCRAHLAQMDTVAHIVRTIERSRNATQFHLLFVPRVQQLCEDQLKLRGVFGSLTIGRLACHWFAIDHDLLSMEWPHTLRSIHVDRDPTVLFAAAGALRALQRRFGRIGRVYAKGDCAAKVWQLCKDMQRDDADADDEQTSVPAGHIDQLIVLDRSVDLLSVLATQLTYEGLIDEQFAVRQCAVRFPAETFASGLAAELTLHSGDELFGELRDRHVHAVGAILSRHVKAVQAFQNFQHRDIREINAMVGEIPRMLAKKAAIAQHSSIAYALKDRTESLAFRDELRCEQEFLMCEQLDRPSAFVERLVAERAPLRSVLRLICVQCQAASGLRAKVLEHYKRELAGAYGVQALLSVGNLERAGLLRAHTGQRTYAALRKTLALTVDEADQQQPTDIGYVHGAYAPLSVRIVERSLRPRGWQALADVLGSLAGPTLSERTADARLDGQLMAGSGRRSSLSSERSLGEPRTVLVLFVGGCTFAEVSALRFVAQEDGGVEFVVATTELLNKNSFLDAFIEGDYK